MYAQKVEATLERLSKNLDLLAPYQTNQASVWRHKLLSLKASLQFKIFENNYMCSLPAESAPSVEARRTAFLSELSALLDEKNHFVELNKTEQKTFDGFLLGAADCVGGVTKTLSDEERCLLLQYVLLNRYVEDSVTQKANSSMPTFFTSADIPQISLPHLRDQNDIEKHAASIRTAWDKIASQLQQVSAEKFSMQLVTAITKLIPSTYLTNTS